MGEIITGVYMRLDRESKLNKSWLIATLMTELAKRVQ